MKKFFEKNETIICMLLIVLYVMIGSYCKQNWGTEDYRSTLVHTAFSVVLVALAVSLKRTAYYGLVKVTNLKMYLYFVPLLLISSVNLWSGINTNLPLGVVLPGILTMINTGFIEEMIFRGFLFKMMEKDNLKSAILVSAITFGIGHIVNLLNGAALVSTLMQMCYGAAIGYLFVIIFYRSKSIVPCIISHALINATSIINLENENMRYIAPAFLMIVPLGYAYYINRKMKETESNT